MDVVNGLDSSQRQQLTKFADELYPSETDASSFLKEFPWNTLLELLETSTRVPDVDLLLKVLERLCSFPALERSLFAEQGIPRVLDAGSKSSSVSIRAFVAKEIYRLSKTQNLTWSPELRSSAVSACVILAVDDSPGINENALSALIKMVELNLEPLESILKLLERVSPTVTSFEQFATCVVRLAKISPEAFDAVKEHGLCQVFRNFLLTESQRSSDILMHLVVLDLLFELLTSSNAVAWTADSDVNLLQYFCDFVQNAPLDEPPVDAAVFRVVERILEFGSPNVIPAGLATGVVSRLTSILSDSDNTFDEIYILAALRLFACLLRTQRDTFVTQNLALFTRVFELALSLRIKTELRNAALEALREGIEELEESEDVEQHLRSHLFELIEAVKQTGSRLDSRRHIFLLMACIFHKFPKLALLSCSDPAFARCLIDRTQYHGDAALKEAQVAAAKSLHRAVPPATIVASLGAQQYDQQRKR